MYMGNNWSSSWVSCMWNGILWLQSSWKKSLEKKQITFFPRQMKVQFTKPNMLLLGSLTSLALAWFIGFWVCWPLCCSSIETLWGLQIKLHHTVSTSPTNFRDDYSLFKGLECKKKCIVSAYSFSRMKTIIITSI